MVTVARAFATFFVILAFWYGVEQAAFLMNLPSNFLVLVGAFLGAGSFLFLIVSFNLLWRKA